MYNGLAQELVEAGSSEDGKICYALGDETKADGVYTEVIPKATEAGTYHVWYKVTGDEKHTDSNAGCVTVTIKE